MEKILLTDEEILVVLKTYNQNVITLDGVRGITEAQLEKVVEWIIEQGVKDANDSK